MKFRLTVFFLIIIDIYCGAVTLSLRESVVLPRGSDILLSDVVLENICCDENVIIRRNVTSHKSRLRTSDILAALSENGIYDISLFGSDVIVRTDDSENVDEYNDGTYLPLNAQNDSNAESNIQSGMSHSDISAVAELERYLSKYVDGTYILTVSVNRVTPTADLHSLSNYKWELPKIKSGLSDIVNLKKLTMTSDGRRYSVYIDVAATAAVYMAVKQHRNGEQLTKGGWTKKIVDVSLYRDCEHIVTAMPTGQWSLTENVEPGQILRWTSLTAVPLVRKGEPLTALSENGTIRLSVPCSAVSDGYLGEPLRIMLANGNEKVGILQSNKTVKF
ncbi:MAG: flagella basal body P-ring formation protein FlgA [Spirochaetales bacterium]|nr:flagella basal body P-ring formation protein FlgA [Spirochaetales bacterium]